MIRSTASDHVRSRLVGPALAVLALAYLAPDVARAGCVHPGSDGPDHFLLLRASGALAETGPSPRLGDAPTMPTPGPGGCTGPYCSDRSERPLTTSWGATPRLSQWAVLDAPAPPSPPTWSPCGLDDGALATIVAADPIFHPPR